MALDATSPNRRSRTVGSIGTSRAESVFPAESGRKKSLKWANGLCQAALRMTSSRITRQPYLQLGNVMSATSICGLGQVAASPMQTLVRFFPDEAKKKCSGAKAKGAKQ